MDLAAIIYLRGHVGFITHHNITSPSIDLQDLVKEILMDYRLLHYLVVVQDIENQDKRLIMGS